MVGAPAALAGDDRDQGRQIDILGKEYAETAPAPPAARRSSDLHRRPRRQPHLFLVALHRRFDEQHPPRLQQYSRDSTRHSANTVISNNPLRSLMCRNAARPPREARSRFASTTPASGGGGARAARRQRRRLDNAKRRQAVFVFVQRVCRKIEPEGREFAGKALRHGPIVDHRQMRSRRVLHRLAEQVGLAAAPVLGDLGRRGAGAVPAASATWRRLGSMESNAPAWARFSIWRRLREAGSRRAAKSNRSTKRPFASLSATISVIAPAPTLRTAASA